MRRFYLIDSIKFYIISQPPAIVFLLCLLSFIVVLSSFNGYISKNKVDNPDELDWNLFRERMASLEFCVKYPEKNSPNKIEESLNAEKQNQDNEFTETYKYDLTFNVIYQGNLSGLFDLDFLDGSIDGFLMGIDKGKIDIKFQIDNVRVNDFSCRNSDKRDCKNFIIDGCVTLKSSTNIFPKTKAPRTCSNRKNNKKESKKVKLSNHFTSLTAYKETPELTTQYWCPSSFGAKTKIKNTDDPSLNAFLTPTDKIIICRNIDFIIVILSIILTISIIYGTIKAAKKKSLYYTQVEILL